MKRQTSVLFYIVSAYVVLQFAWWAYHLFDLTSSIQDHSIQNKQFFMIVGEGIVFFIILIVGLWKIRSSIQKEIRISKRQNNFLLSVTHELKTPIASNRLTIQTLLKRKQLNREAQEQLLADALEENGRLEEMVTNILTASRIENKHLKLSMERVNLSEKISDITLDWSKNRKNIELDIEPNIHYTIDLFVIQTVLHNLLENAHKYAGNNPEIQVYLYHTKDKIIMGVKDNGKGIPVQHRVDMFQKFVRIGNEETRQNKGTGLGLYLVKNLLLLQGANIKYHDVSPNGADFRIAFPIKN